MLEAVVVVLASAGVLSLVASGTLRLNRRDLKEHVLRRARELAESGRFEGWEGMVSSCSRQKSGNDDGRPFIDRDHRGLEQDLTHLPELAARDRPRADG